MTSQLAVRVRTIEQAMDCTLHKCPCVRERRYIALLMVYPVDAGWRQRVPKDPCPRCGAARLISLAPAIVFPLLTEPDAYASQRAARVEALRLTDPPQHPGEFDIYVCLRLTRQRP